MTWRLVVKQEGLDVDWHLREGIPSDQIGQTALEQRADLIVIGTHGRTGLDHIMLGSTAERVIKQAPCPTLTVRVAPVHGEKDVDVPPCTAHLLVPVILESVP